MDNPSNAESALFNRHNRGHNSKQVNGGAGVSHKISTPLDTLTLVNYNASHELTGANLTSSTSLDSNNSIGSLWTRNMWPKYADGLAIGGSQANLIIQWSILIGSLLTTLLLITLLLRKLFIATFPSYHWMLAKQTIKSSSASQMDADCCPHHTHHAVLHPSNGPASYPPILNSLGPPHVHHYEGPWSQVSSGRCPTFSSPTVAGVLQQYGGQPGEFKNLQRGEYQQFVLDSNGRHIVFAGSLGAKFNTDATLNRFTTETGHLATPANTANSGSSGSAGRHGRSRHANKEYDTNSVASSIDYHYDTVDCAQNEYCNSVQLDPNCQDMGFYLTKDFVPLNTQHQNGRSTKVERRSTGDRLEELEQRDDSQSLDREHRRRNSERVKHTSPNVPQVAGLVEVNDDQPLEGNPRDIGPPDAQSGGIGDSSSVGSTGDSSPSVQSTTAPMLSNANSSSFEQAAEISDYAAPLETHANASVSAGTSPAGAKARARAIKIAHQDIAAPQSQPNSPMFVKQFSNSRSGASMRNKSGPMFGSAHRPRLKSRVMTESQRGAQMVHKQVNTKSRVGTIQRPNDNCDIEVDDERRDGRHFYEEVDRKDCI